MLLFIGGVSSKSSRQSAFQNIVCYCLSISPFSCRPLRRISKHRMLLFIKDEIARMTELAEFQNIVCYCLSGWWGGYAERRKFQNIVCYCLSNFGKIGISSLYNFKTSYVTVYLMISSYFPISYFHYFLYFTPFRLFLPANYQI